MVYRYAQYLAWRRESHALHETCRYTEGSQIPSITIAEAPFYRIIQERYSRKSNYRGSAIEEAETGRFNPRCTENYLRVDTVPRGPKHVPPVATQAGGRYLQIC